MSILVQILRVHASRRAQRQQTQREWDEITLSPQAIRVRRYRRVLASLLITIGAISFIEVVLLPGAMIRRNLMPGTSEAAASSENEHELRLPFGLMTSDQKAAHRQEELERLEEELRATHQKLGNACLELKKENAELDQYSMEKLHLVPSTQPSSTVPASLVDVVAHEPTGLAAWERLLQLSPQVAQTLSDTQDFLGVVSSRLSSGSFLPDDDRDMRALIDRVNESLSAVRGARSCIDHLSVLERARSALARQQSLEQTTGDSQ